MSNDAYLPELVWGPTISIFHYWADGHFEHFRLDDPSVPLPRFRALVRRDLQPNAPSEEPKWDGIGTEWDWNRFTFRSQTASIRTMDKKDKPDPFANLGPPGIAKRFATPIVAKAVEKVFIDAERKLMRSLTAEVNAANEAEERERLQFREQMLAELRVIAEGKQKRKPGRPKSDKPKPWEGICSKTEWYRRKKAGK